MEKEKLVAIPNEIGTVTEDIRSLKLNSLTKYQFWNADTAFAPQEAFISKRGIPIYLTELPPHTLRLGTALSLSYEAAADDLSADGIYRKTSKCRTAAVNQVLDLARSVLYRIKI